MELGKVLAELQEIKKANEKFLLQEKEEILELILKENVTAEEALQQEIMSELLDKIQRINHVIQYLEKNTTLEGILSRDAKDNILFSGKIMPPMRELEIYVYDELREKMVWTRTFVSIATDEENPYLVGLGHGLDIDGIRARIRE